GFLGNFLSKGLKTNQLVVNTDEKTLKPIARLKEPRDLFALPKDKDNDCSQQAPRWPVECQVIEERITHIPYVPSQPEPLNIPTGNELKPRPVGEENGIVVFTYCPISAVNYESSRAMNKTEDKSSEDSDDSSDSRNDFTPYSRRTPLHSGKSKLNSVSKILNRLDDRSTSNSQDDDDDDDDYDSSGNTLQELREKNTLHSLIEAKKKRYGSLLDGPETSKADTSKISSKETSDIEDIWKNNSTECRPASPNYVLSQFGKKTSKALINKFIDQDDQPSSGASSSASSKVHNKYAVTPFKLPKTNITRLEVAFQNNTRQSIKKQAPTASMTSSPVAETDENKNSSDEYSRDSSDTVKGQLDFLRAYGGGGRLTGGADRRPSTSPSSVSDTDTLVGDESVCRLACKRKIHYTFVCNLQKEAWQTIQTNQSNQTSLGKRQMSMAAAVAAVARGRRRGFEPDQACTEIGNLTHMTTCTNTSTFELNLSDKNCPEMSLNEKSSTYQSQTLSYDFPQTQFSRSAVGGAKFVTNCHPMNADEYDSLEFESRFESGNLAKAVQITPTYYELYLRPDLYTSRSKQWFYFRVRRTHRNMLYRFSIVNLVKSDSLYNDGMRPVMYSTLGAKEKNEGWRRCGNNISYYRNDDESTNNNNEEDEDNSSYTLTFTIEFEHDDDTVYFAHSYPYTYSDLQDYLMEIQRHPVKSKFCKLRLLCRTLAGNNVYYLTVTAPSSNEENMRRKKSIVISARVHPSETPSSWMMKGLMDFITGDTTVAKRLRHKFIFKLVPMLNPDGVIVGNTRNSLTGKDLNRQYRTVIRETYPSIWYTKAMIRRLIEECGVAMYCDMHAHSRKHNIFIYGCENKRNPEKRLTEQVFPLMLHKNSADRFSFESCKFKIQRSKEGTGRIVVWMLGITNSYTIEASFGGSSLGSRKGTHFNTQDYEHMGRAFCETLLDYCDENPNKILNLLKQQERLRSKIIERLMREGSSADEPLNIPLSDYSSDEGNCSSSSDNEGKHSITASDLEGPCCAPIRAPPSSPEVLHEIRKFRVRRMHKVMHVLDQVYFSPVLQRKFKALARLKRRRHKLGKVASAKRQAGGGLATTTVIAGPSSPSGTITEKQSPSDVRAQITTKIPKQQLAESESSDSLGSQSSDSITDDGCNDGKQTVKAPRRKRKQKKKVMQIEKGKSKSLNRKMRIDRNLRLWLANRRIFIFRRKKNRRQRVRGKPLKKRGEVVRTALDLPTTDPGSDLHFSTDDEELSPTSNNMGFCVVAPLRHTLLQSELQRRYIEEIGDMVVQKPKPAHMPPELIVTTPSKSSGPGGVKKLEVYKLTPRTAPEQQLGGSSQLHDQSNASAARRTYSWHNLNQQEASTPAGGSHASHNFYVNDTKAAVKVHRPPPRRVPCNFIPLAQQRHANADDLQLKLSLKKKIWTGAHGEPEDRPLAWYKSHQSQIHHAHMANMMATAAAAAAICSTRGEGSGGVAPGSGPPRNIYATGSKNREPLVMPSATTTAPQLPPTYLGAARRPRKLEQVDLFTACSQKLLLWQQEHKKLQPTHLRLMGGTSAKLAEGSQLIMRGCKPKKTLKAAAATSDMLTSVNIVHGNNASTGKGKRKSSVMKLAETTLRTRSSVGVSAKATATAQQQLTQMQHLIFKRTHGSGTEHTHQLAATRNVGGGGLGSIGGGGGHSFGRTPSKFKAGGIVVTAVQQPTTLNPTGNGGVTRRVRHSVGLHIKSSSGATVDGHGGATVLQYRGGNHKSHGNQGHLLQANKSAAGISLDTVSLVRKVKTKLKKRKSRTLSNAAAA
ncbi:hypothetical protein KR222_004671, partial [Zaprionus bogoriensis]